MLEAKKISIEEAAQLLDALENNDTIQRTEPSKKARVLRIKVYEDGEPKVNINVPLPLARLLKNFIPPQAREKLERDGIDINKISEIISNGELDKLTGEKLVEVNDDGNKVEIYIE